MRRRQAQTHVAEAVQELVHTAVLEIRTMAYLRRGLQDGSFDGAEYQEQIRLLADVCDTLLPGLGSRREYTPQQALRYTWESRNDGQRDWIRNTLRAGNFDVEGLLETR